MSEICLPDVARLRAAGFLSAAHVPVIFGKVGNKRFYCREYNRYLRERAHLDWHPRGDTADERQRAGRTLSYPSRKSLVNYAERLGNFDGWLTATMRDWRTAEYTSDIVQGYQADMLAGRWANNGRELKPSTTNARVLEACYFLRWAAERGFRPPFRVIGSSISVWQQSNAGTSHKARLTIPARAGAVSTVEEPFIDIPTVGLVTTWLKAVRTQRDYTKELMCRFVLRTAVRLAEAAEFRYGDFPDPETTPWHVVGGKVALKLVHGTKGRKTRNKHDEELGPSRTIWIPVDLAEELLQYIRLRRLKAAAKFRRRMGRLPNNSSDRFFLGETDGTPISKESLYRAWKTRPLPQANWHPHLGRHYWCCMTLLAELEVETRIARMALKDMPDAWVYEVGRTKIDTILRPQLGHLSSKTTALYLRWITSVTTLADHYIDWHAHLETVGD